MEMGATVAFQEDGSLQNEAEYQQWLRIGQVKVTEIDIKRSQSHQEEDENNKEMIKVLS